MSNAPKAAGATVAGAGNGSDSGELSHREIMVILAGLMSAMFLASLDQTIVSTSIRTIADDLHGLDAQAWVTTAYLMTATISTPLYGKLSDIYGRRPFFIGGIVVFVLGSLLCAMAGDMYVLAAFRGIQGIGAGALMPLALAIIGDIIPPRQRAKYQGYMMAVFASSSVLGPVIGGLFANVDTLLGVAGWRWVFLINVPIGLISLVLVIVTLRLNTQRTPHRIDWGGAATIVLALVPILLVAEQGRIWGWGSTGSIICYVVGTLGVLAFVWFEGRMGDEALIPLRIFRHRELLVTIIGGIIVGVAMFGGMMTIPLYMQIVHGASPMESGFMMLPMVLGMMVTSIVVGRFVSRTGHVRRIPVIGCVVLACGLLLLSTVTADTPLWQVMGYIVVVGIGLGHCMQPLVLIAQNAVEPREMGMATSATTFFRQMGGTLGVAVFLSILFGSVGGRIADEMRTAANDGSLAAGIAEGMASPEIQANPALKGIVDGLANPSTGLGALDSVTKDSSVISQLPTGISHPLEQGFALAIGDIFLYVMPIALLGALVLWFLPPITLRSSSGQAAGRVKEVSVEPETDASASDSSSSDNPATDTPSRV